MKGSLQISLRLGILFLAVIALISSSSGNPTFQRGNPPDFNQHILPVFTTRCLGCHNSQAREGGLSLETYSELLKGGVHGPGFVLGHSDQSQLMLRLEGKVQPTMPVGGQPLKAEEIARIRAWIDAGAPATTVAEGAGPAEPPLPSVPDLKPSVPVTAQVCALGFDPRGQILAVGGYKEILLFSLKDIQSTPVKLAGPDSLVQSVAFSPDGSLLVAAGGLPARSGEVVLYDVRKGIKLKHLHGHEDTIHSVSFSPDGKLLATSSYDRLVKLWDVETGKEWKTLKDHVDAVYPVAFSPDGRWVASGSADFSVKVWEVSSGRRLFTLGSAQGAILTLAFHPTKNQLVAAGADKRLRFFMLNPNSGTELRTIVSHTESVLRVLFTADGKKLVSAGADRTIKVWDSETGQLLKAFERQNDWVLALALTADGRWLAVGTYAGSVHLYNFADGNLSRVLVSGPVHSMATK